MFAALVLVLIVFAVAWTFALLKLLGVQDAERRPETVSRRDERGGEVQGIEATVVDSTATQSERGTFAAVSLDDFRLGGCG